MFRDPIVNEVRCTRKKIEKELGNNFDKMQHFFREKQRHIDPARIRKAPKRTNYKFAA
jgi:hypothetical protein